MKHARCSVPTCYSRASYALYYTWESERKWGPVCARHDNLFGRQNLKAWLLQTSPYLTTHEATEMAIDMDKEMKIDLF